MAAFPGHTACETAYRSELLVPMFDQRAVIGVFDLDSPVTARFTEEDRTGCERLVGLIAPWLARL